MTTNYQTGEQSGQDVKEKLRQDMNHLKQDLGELKQDVSAKAREASRHLADKGKEKAASLSSKAADKLEDVEAAAEAEADALEDIGWTNLSGYIREVADGIGNLSDNLRNKSVDELVHDASELARRNTGLFLLGSVAIGFGLSRLAKAANLRASEGQWNAADYGDSASYAYPGGEGRAAYEATTSEDYETRPYESH